MKEIANEKSGQALTGTDWLLHTAWKSESPTSVAVENSSFSYSVRLATSHPVAKTKLKWVASW